MKGYAALGDSFTIGVGSRDSSPRGPGQEHLPKRWRGFAELLADSLEDTELHLLAQKGALMGDVEHGQLTAALALEPSVVSVIVGMNDALRPNFDIDRIAASAERVIGSLQASGALVLTVRLPDPGRMFGLGQAGDNARGHKPNLLSAISGQAAMRLARRMVEVNEVMAAMAAHFGTLHLDLSDDPKLYAQQMWAPDHLHPSEEGHRHIARGFHFLLKQAGYTVGAPPGAEPQNKPLTRAELLAWRLWVLDYKSRRSKDIYLNLALEVLSDADTQRVDQAWRLGGPGTALPQGAGHSLLRAHNRWWSRRQVFFSGVAGAGLAATKSALAEAGDPAVPRQPGGAGRPASRGRLVHPVRDAPGR